MGTTPNSSNQLLDYDIGALLPNDEHKVKELIEKKKKL